MAWLERTVSGHFKVAFRFGGCRFKRSLKTKNERSAQATASRLEENIRLIESGRLTIPDGADVATFLLSDGKLNSKPQFPKVMTLGDLFEAYTEGLPTDALEHETLRIAQIHFGHIRRILGERFTAAALRHQDLQEYVVQRSKERGKRAQTVSSATIRKELSTLRTVWSWAVERGFARGVFPNRNLRFPKVSEKPPFQTWTEISRQIALSGVTELEQAELWDCLFLTLEEIDAVLDHIREQATYRFLYPMAVTAAHTGARRSELSRSRVADFDLKGGIVLIREKKRVRGKRTVRQIPMSGRLREVMARWFEEKRASVYAFPVEYRVRRDRKLRENADAVSPEEASHHLERVLAGSKWEKIRGWHVFRHSFISNCAAKGIDQRMIDRWSGHQTDEMRRRYTHLFPDLQHRAMELVFGHGNAQ